MDCLLCCEDGLLAAQKMLDNICAALTPGGTLILLTHSPPSRRRFLFECPTWENPKVGNPRPSFPRGNCERYKLIGFIMRIIDVFLQYADISCGSLVTKIINLKELKE